MECASPFVLPATTTREREAVELFPEEEKVDESEKRERTPLGRDDLPLGLSVALRRCLPYLTLTIRRRSRHGVDSCQTLRLHDFVLAGCH